MRPLLALFLGVAIFGGVGAYLEFLHELRSWQAARSGGGENVDARASGVFSLEITLTFDAGGEDPFALEPTEGASLVVRLRDREILRVDEPVAAGTPVRVDDVAGVTAGVNEFYVEARPSGQARPIAHALRVRIFRDGNPVAEETLWSEPGLPVRGVVRIDVGKTASEDEHDH